MNNELLPLPCLKVSITIREKLCLNRLFALQHGAFQSFSSFNSIITTSWRRAYSYLIHQVLELPRAVASTSAARALKGPLLGAQLSR